MSWLTKPISKLRQFLAGQSPGPSAPPRPGEARPSLTKSQWSDRAIEDTGQDSLSFQDYANVLAQRAATANTPVTMGVFGRWGSGKTSLMRLIDGALPGHAPSGDRLESAWIDVWQLSSQEDMGHAFLHALLSEVQRRASFWRLADRKTLLRQLAVNSYRIVIVLLPVLVGQYIGDPEASWTDVLSLLVNPFGSNLAAGAGTLLTYALAVWLLLKPAVEAVRGGASFDPDDRARRGPGETQATELGRARGRFERAVEALVGPQGRLVVFIDNLDQCTPEKMLDALETLRLFTSTPRCVYLIGMDYDVVRRAIKTRFGFETEAAATEYLEKIVLIPFHMPSLEQKRMEGFIEECFPGLGRACPEAVDVFSLGLEPNPRKVKRALNIYRNLLDLAQVRVDNWEMDPVAPELVAKMVVIESRFRRLHEYLLQEPGFLLQLEQRALEGNGLHEDLLREDGSLGEVLLEEPSGTGLIERAGLRPLNAILRVEGKRFNDDNQRSQISSYFYLIATTEGATEGMQPHHREREALLGGDPEKIQEQVAQIRECGAPEVQVYVERLMGVLRDPDRYTPSEKLSANVALDLLERWEREPFEPLTLRVPAGPFTMGDDEHEHVVGLADFRIGRYPVTNAEYARFIEDGGYETREYWIEAGWEQMRSEGRKQPNYWDEDEWNGPSQPVVGVGWYEAMAYCKWLAGATGRQYRLPSEAEWEKAARGSDGRLWPWGSQWDPTRLNGGDQGPGRTTEVGQYSPEGDSPYGCADMAGNAWEWTLSLNREYPYQADDGREDLSSAEPRVLRGGAFFNSEKGVRCTFRYTSDPRFRYRSGGIRVVVAAGRTTLR